MTCKYTITQPYRYVEYVNLKRRPQKQKLAYMLMFVVILLSCYATIQHTFYYQRSIIYCVVSVTLSNLGNTVTCSSNEMANRTSHFIIISVNETAPRPSEILNTANLH